MAFVFKLANLASFWKAKTYSQAVIPDKSILKVPKLLENDKIGNFLWDILGDF